MCIYNIPLRYPVYFFTFLSLFFFQVTAAWGSAEERKNVLDAVLAVLATPPECDAADL